MQALTLVYMFLFFISSDSYVFAYIIIIITNSTNVFVTYKGTINSFFPMQKHNDKCRLFMSVNTPVFCKAGCCRQYTSPYDPQQSLPSDPHDAVLVEVEARYGCDIGYYTLSTIGCQVVDMLTALSIPRK